MRDIKTGQRLRTQGEVYGQKTLFDYNAPRPTYFYANINPKYPSGKYRWRDTGSARSEKEILIALVKSLMYYYPSSGFVLRESADALSRSEARARSVGMMVRMKNDPKILGFRVRYDSGHVPDFLYVYFKRETYADHRSVPYIVRYKGNLQKFPQVDYDPYRD